MGGGGGRKGAEWPKTENSEISDPWFKGVGEKKDMGNKKHGKTLPNMVLLRFVRGFTWFYYVLFRGFTWFYNGLTSSINGLDW